MVFALCVLYLYFQTLPFYTQFNSPFFFPTDFAEGVCRRGIASFTFPFSETLHSFYSEAAFLHCQNSCVSSKITNSHIKSGSIFLYGFSLYLHKPTSPKACSLKEKLREETGDIFSFQ